MARWSESCASDAVIVGGTSNFSFGILISRSSWATAGDETKSRAAANSVWVRRMVILLGSLAGRA